MSATTTYIAKKPDHRGHIHYTAEENRVWQTLYERQMPLIRNAACEEYTDALERLALPTDRVPQCADVSAVLSAASGWQVVPVPALIDASEFFQLLSERKFPAASFIRRRAELDYLREPDIFHEIFGHAPLLTDPRFAAFTHAYGKAGLAASPADRDLLARLYWFTVEFGLIRNAQGELRVYGAGIVSSIGETPYALKSDLPQRHEFDPVDIMRTPYRIDEFQKNYFIIDSFEQLFALADADLQALVDEARRLGDKPVLTSIAS